MGNEEIAASIAQKVQNNEINLKICPDGPDNPYTAKLQDALAAHKNLKGDFMTAVDQSKADFKGLLKDDIDKCYRDHFDDLDKAIACVGDV